MRTRCWVVLAAALLVVAGCSSDKGKDDDATATTRATTTASTSTTEPATTAPTTTATTSGGPSRCPAGRDDVGDVLGAQVSTVLAVNGGSLTDVRYEGTGCNYELPDAAGRVTISVLKPDDGKPDLFGRLSAAAKDSDRENGVAPVSGIGTDALRDGEQLAVRTDQAIVFTEVEPADDEDPPADPIAAAKVLARAVLPKDLVAGNEGIGCEPLVSVVANALKSAVEDSGVSSRSETLGDLTLSATGCRYGLADGRSAKVLVADPALWETYVQAKQGSTFAERYEETTLGERSAFFTKEALWVEDGDEVIKVDTSDLGKGTGKADDDLRRSLARLALAG